MEAFDRSYIDSIDEVAGNPAAIDFVRRFGADIESGRARKPLMIYGPSGTGKTLLAHMLAKAMGWNLVEMSAADYRDGESITRLLHAAAVSRSIFGARNMILLDEIDDLAGRFDAGAASAKTALIEKSRNPIVFTANDMWDQSISFLRARAEPVELKRLTMADITKILHGVLRKTAEHVDAEVVETIAGRSAGDARSAINDLIVMVGSDKSMIDAIGLRDRKTDVFNALDKIFLSHTLSTPLRAMANTDVDNDMMVKWIDENIPHRYSGPEDLSGAYESLSYATRFATRASRSQYYTYWRYMNVLMSSGVALAKSRNPEMARRYSFPRIISALSSSKAGRQESTAIAAKLQRRVHSSRREIKSSTIPLLARMARAAMEKGADKEQVYDFFMEKFELSEKEVDSLIAKGGSRQAL